MAVACGIRTGERNNNDPTNHCEIRLAPSFLSDEESTGQENKCNVVAIYLKLNRLNFPYLFAKLMLRLNKNIFFVCAKPKLQGHAHKSEVYGVFCISYWRRFLWSTPPVMCIANRASE